MTTALTRRRPRHPACACRTLWLVDFGNDDPRGEKPVSPYTAAVASAMGYRVRLVSYATGMLRPFVLPGTTCGKVHVAEVCETCGAPTKLEFDE